MKKTYIILAIAATALIPVSVFAVDQTDIEIEAKLQLEEIIKQLQDDVDKATAQDEIERLEKLLAGANDLKDVVTLGEQVAAATGDEKVQLEAQLLDKMADLDEHAGDRYHHTEITEVEQSGNHTSDSSGDDPLLPQSAWPPQAYASNDLTDFEFWKNNYGDCDSYRYSMEFSGVIDSGDNDISLDWAFPRHMYVENHDDDIWNDCVYVNYEAATLSHYGIDSDGVYYCGAYIPSYHSGVSNYACPYVDSGEVNVLRTWVDYEDDDSDNDRNISLTPLIRVLILE